METIINSFVLTVIVLTVSALAIVCVLLLAGFLSQFFSEAIVGVVIFFAILWLMVYLLYKADMK